MSCENKGNYSIWKFLQNVQSCTCLSGSQNNQVWDLIVPEGPWSGAQHLCPHPPRLTLSIRVYTLSQTKQALSGGWQLFCRLRQSESPISEGSDCIFLTLHVRILLNLWREKSPLLWSSGLMAVTETIQLSLASLLRRSTMMTQSRP